jgi:preprotein translocase subunit SecG
MLSFVPRAHLSLYYSFASNVIIALIARSTQAKKLPRVTLLIFFLMLVLLLALGLVNHD